MICNNDCFNCIHDDCINDYVKPRYSYKPTAEQKKRHRENANEKYYEFKARGICVKCHKRPAIPGKVLCVECRNKANRRKVEKYRKTAPITKNREYRREHGLCIYCESEVMPGRTICEKCYLQRVECARKAHKHENLIRLREYWKKDRGAEIQAYIQERDAKNDRIHKS